MLRKVLCVSSAGLSAFILHAFLKKELGDEYRIEYAGIWCGPDNTPIHQFSLRCLEERGITLNPDSRSRCITRLPPTDEVVYLVCMNNEAAQEASLLASHRHTVVVANEFSSVPDLCGRDYHTYKACADLLCYVASRLAKKIRYKNNSH